MYVDSDHIKQWLGNGLARLVDDKISNEFANYLNTLKWSLSGSHLDISESNLNSINLSKNEDSEFINDMQNSTDFTDKKLYFFYKKNQPSIVCELGFGLNNIDYAYSRAPGYRFMFCETLFSEKTSDNFENILMYDHGDILYYKKHLIKSNKGHI